MMGRFWEKVQKTDTCWLWTANLDSDGYGHFQLSNRDRRAHRVAYELAISPIPIGFEIDHLCRVRNCVNPAHLEAVTHAENVRRSAAVITTCRNGHAYTEANTYRRPNGRRDCRTCIRDRVREYKARMRVSAA